MRRFLIVVSLLLSQMSWAGANGLDSYQVIEGAPGYLAQLPSHQVDDLTAALIRAEMLLVDGELTAGYAPVTFVLHGPEVSVFFKDNYSKNQGLLDLAAKLTAFGVVDIRICETQTGILGEDKSALVPFVGTVPYGPAEERRLLKEEGYVYF